MANCVKEGKENGGNVHQTSSTTEFDKITQPSPRRKLPCVPLSLTTVDVNPTAITAMPSPMAIPSHASVATITAHVTAGTNNGSESDISDGILDIIEMGSPPNTTVALISLRNTTDNKLPQEQISLQEEVSVTGNPNTASATSEPSFVDLDKRNINQLLRRL